MRSIVRLALLTVATGAVLVVANVLRGNRPQLAGGPQGRDRPRRRLPAAASGACVIARSTAGAGALPGAGTGAVWLWACWFCCAICFCFSICGTP